MSRDLSSTYLELKEPLIVLTVPKSGTHLITNILREIFGEARVDPGMIAAEKIPPGIGDTPYIYHTHLIYSPPTSLALRRVRKVLLVRDPRDVAASFTRAIYNRKIPPDNVQSYLLQNGFSLDEILSFVIQGGTIGGSTYPDLGSLYRLYYWGWRATTELVLHYEHLLPDRGDFSGPETAIGNLLASLDVDVPEEFPLAERIREGSAPERSQTFDRGRARSWETDFAPTHHALLNSVAPTLLADLGYASGSRPQPDLGFGGSGEPSHPAAGPAGEAPQPQVERAQIGVDRVARQELARIDALLQRVKSLDDHVPQRISLMNFAMFQLWLFVWADDAIEHGYRGTADMNLHLTALRARSEQPEVILPRETFSPTVEVCRVALARYEKVHFVHVGCCYGLETMLVAGLLGEYRDRLAITAFDCGLAGRIAPASFDLNGFAARIRFRSEAVTAWDAVTPVFGEYGNMENMRIVNDSVSRDTLSYPVPGIRLDTAFAELDADTKLVLKMHIQGGEFLALAGARQLLDTGRIAAMIVAFTPHALITTDAPVDLLKYVPDGWRIYDLGPNQWTSKSSPVPLPPRSFEAFVKHLSNSYTFLLLHAPDLDLAASRHLTLPLLP